MTITKRKPATVGEILTEEFLRPRHLTQAALAGAMGVPRKHVNQLCNDRRAVTAPIALILARVFGNSPEFWLNLQRRSDHWQAARPFRLGWKGWDGELHPGLDIADRNVLLDQMGERPL